jgi:Dyp-type peroxidase family
MPLGNGGGEIMASETVELPEIEHRGTDPTFPGVRETPSPGLEAPKDQAPARPDAKAEPVLRVANIQGNIIAGFNKDFQTLLFLRITDAAAFRPWLAKFAPNVATAEEVIAFNRLFKRTRDRRGVSGTVKATWINIAFSRRGLEQLRSDVASFTDAPFQAGVVAQSGSLGDPSPATAEGNPANWRVGDGDDGAHAIIIIASDTLADLEAEVTRVEQLIYAPNFQIGSPTKSGATVIFKQEGRTQPGVLAGHEHFGFLDGVSQPGLRGRLSNLPNDVLTPRQNPDNPNQGKPGQDLLWPGEFIFGYQGQDAQADINQPGRDSMLDDSDQPRVPDWGRDGSYLVFRRLRQDVGGFHKFLNDEAARLSVAPTFLGAKLVGRWPSGAPIMRASTADDPTLGDDDCANNNFEFQDATDHTQQQRGRNQCQDTTFPTSPGDKTGDICPFAAHIRKSYPRDDEADPQAPGYGGQKPDLPNEEDTQTHRLLRRGIPFGDSSRSTPGVPIDDGVDRGLLFMAYMTSIVDQFEFVTQQWVNKVDFKDPGSGIDPILGQADNAGDRTRTFKVKLSGNDQSLQTGADWVIPTGGGYFFAPSIKALSGELTS